MPKIIPYNTILPNFPYNTCMSNYTINYMNYITWLPFNARQHHTVQLHTILYHAIPYHSMPHNTIPYHFNSMEIALFLLLLRLYDLFFNFHKNISKLYSVKIIVSCVRIKCCILPKKTNYKIIISLFNQKNRFTFSYTMFHGPIIMDQSSVRSVLK